MKLTKLILLFAIVFFLLAVTFAAQTKENKARDEIRKKNHERRKAIQKKTGVKLVSQNKVNGRVREEYHTPGNKIQQAAGHQSGDSKKYGLAAASKDDQKFIQDKVIPDILKSGPLDRVEPGNTLTNYPKQGYRLDRQPSQKENVNVHVQLNGPRGDAATSITYVHAPAKTPAHVIADRTSLSARENVQVDIYSGTDTDSDRKPKKGAKNRNRGTN